MSDSNKNNILNFGMNWAQSFMESKMIMRFGKYLPGPTKIMFLLQKTYKKEGLEAGVDNIAKDLFEKTKLLGQFITAYYKNDYREIETWKALAIIGALAYIVSPIDIIPDAIPIIGFMDDLAILTWLMTNLNEELDNFKTWSDINNSYNEAND